MILEQIQTSPIGTNCYVYGDEQTRRAFVIDPGNDAPVILEILRQHDLHVEAIIATHGHWDHLGAVRAVRGTTGAPFLAPEPELEMIRDASVRAQVMMGLPLDQPPDPDRFIYDGDELSAGSLRLRVVGAPGHSPGHVILIGSGLAFVGDVVFAGGIGRTDLPGGDWEVLRHTLETKILTLPDTTILYPGHGPHTTVGRERVSNPFLVGLGGHAG